MQHPSAEQYPIDFAVLFPDRPGAAAIRSSGAAALVEESPNQRRLFDALFAEFAGEGSAVHAQATGGLRDVEAGFGERFVDTLPFERFD